METTTTMNLTTKLPSVLKHQEINKWKGSLKPKPSHPQSEVDQGIKKTMNHNQQSLLFVTYSDDTGIVA